MTIWKDQNTAKKDFAPPVQDLNARKEPEIRSDAFGGHDTPRRAMDVKESVIAADLNIEGKIEGSGHVRIAGRFKGDVHVQGNLTIEAGAKLTGAVRANTVVIGGELEGNIENATKVELLETGVLSGDLKAGSLTVAAGSRMRGQAEFGWGDGQPARMRLEAAAGT